MDHSTICQIIGQLYLESHRRILELGESLARVEDDRRGLSELLEKTLQEKAELTRRLREPREIGCTSGSGN